MPNRAQRGSMTLLEMLPSLRRAATPRIDRAIWPLTTSVDEVGRLCVGGVPLTEVADEFRTPTYVLDEADFRCRIRRYRAALPGVRRGLRRQVAADHRGGPLGRRGGAGLDVCSGGELATALAGGVDPARIIMHGNAKTPDELRDAASVGVGRIVVDSPHRDRLPGRPGAPPPDGAGAGDPRHRHPRAPRGHHRGRRPEVRLHARPADQAAGRGAARPGSAVPAIWSDCTATSARRSPMPRSTARPSARMIAAMADIRARHGVTLTS